MTGHAEDRELPVVKKGQTSGNTSRRSRSVKVAAKPKPFKGASAPYAIKILNRDRERFDDLARAMQMQNPDFTKGELFSAMLDHFLKTKPDATPAGGNIIPPDDARDGRIEEMRVFATPELAAALRRRASNNGWTLSATVENACTIAQEVETKGG